MKGEVSADRMMRGEDGFGLRGEGQGKREPSGLLCSEAESRQIKIGFRMEMGVRNWTQFIYTCWGKCR